MSRLRHLIPAGEQARLAHVLGRILGEAFCVLDESGELLIGKHNAGAMHPVLLNLQEIAQVGAAGASPEDLILATEVFEAMLSAWAWSAQQEQVLRQRYQAEKLASVGRLAAGVAHEINNPAAYIHSNLQMALRYQGLLDELAAPAQDADAAALLTLWQQRRIDQVLLDGHELLNESLRGIERIARIVRDLRVFSCVDRNQEDVVDPNELLTAVAQIIRGQLAQGQELLLDLQPLPAIPCLPGYLNQAFLEILNNARQALNGHAQGKITLTSKMQGDEVVIVVEDNGAGMSQEVLAHVFEPFYTTRDPNEGTGLGLTVARDIILAHDGRIQIDSIPGRGTTVSLTLLGG